jgi:hypothetical protein
MEKGSLITFQAMWQQNGNQRHGGECVFPSQSGCFAGGGAEKTPAGDYSINTHAMEKGVHSEFGTAILFTQENRRCLLLDTLHGLSDEEALWFTLRAWARFQPRASRPRTDTGLMFYQAAYSHVFEKYWDVLEKSLVHPEAADESDFTKACMFEYQAALEGVSLTVPVVDSEAPEGGQIVAKQAAISRLCMVQDAPDKWAEMVDRSSPGSDGPASLSGSGVGTDLVPGLGSTDTCVPCWHPSQT